MVVYDSYRIRQYFRRLSNDINYRNILYKPNLETFFLVHNEKQV